MPSLATPSPLDRILSEHVKNLSNLILGASGYGQRVQLTQYSDATNYANTFGNTDTTNGRAVKIQYGDPSGAPVTLATFQKSGSRIQSNDGTDYIDVSNSGVAVTGTFTVNGSSVGAGLTVYNVLDHGVTEGTSSTFAGANTTALQALWTAVATAGGGTIYFPPGYWSLNATTLNHALGSSASVNLQGSGDSTLLYFHGTTGPFLNVATASSSAVNYGFFRDFQIRHNDTVTSGATLQLGYVGYYRFENIRSIYSDSSKASIISLRLTAIASFLKFIDCKFATRADEATLTSGGLFPVGLEVVQSSGSIGGLEFHGVEFSGCQNRSTGIFWKNTVGIDTVTFSGLCLVKDHETGIRFGFGNDNGGVSNLTANGLYVDGITGQTVHYATGGTAVTQNHQYTGSWFSGDDYIFLIDNSGAGTVTGIQVVGSYLTGGATRLVTVGGVVNELAFVGNRMTCDANAAGKVALDIGDGSAAVTDVTITGNRIAVGGSSADAVVRMNAAVDSFAIVGNVLRRGADADGIVNTPGAGASRVVANNSFL